MTDELARPGHVTREEHGDTLAIGQWYWVNGSDGEWFGCITKFGSNYVKVTSVAGGSVRIHNDLFAATCRLEPDPESVVQRNVEALKATTGRLLREVQEATARLGVTPRQSLQDGGETQALVRVTGTGPVNDYAQALVLAKDKTLPELFEKVRKTNEKLSEWLSAGLRPLEAQARGLEPIVKAIKARIFSVQLYAGLSEDIVQVTDGEPAGLAEPVVLLQRRHYMDEECLARYEVGGMEFKDLRQFDAWLARPANRDRILPFPRCMVAFQVRRHSKEREAASWREFIEMALSNEGALDRLTFLYMRNGEQVFRLKTAIEFDARLFPDTEHSVLAGTGAVYAKYFTSVDKRSQLVSEAEYQRMRHEYIEGGRSSLLDGSSKRNQARRRKEVEREEAAHEPVSLGFYSWVRWSPESVYYDDISAMVKSQVDAHNRIVTVMQGLLDRSQVFHPHPPYQLWTAEGFRQAVRLVYDDSRALTSGEKPDFEAYRSRLNAGLRPGNVTVGQQDAWLRREATRENSRRAGSRNHYELTHHKPYGDPGPGLLARVVHVKKGSAIYRWRRGRRRYQRWGSEEMPRCSVEVRKDPLLNADAYTPGDYRQFYDDPRTRAEYLQWAPLLLACEEYKAGNKAPRKSDLEPGDE